MENSERDSLESLMMKIATTKKSETLFDSVDEKMKSISDVAKTSKAISDAVSVKDDYGNDLMAIGTKDKVETFTSYGFSNDTLNWSLWTALYSDSWVFKRAIDKPSQDEIRCGVTLLSQSDKQDEVYKLYTNCKTSMIELIQWGALYGGSIACMLFDDLDDDQYAKPLTREILKKRHVIRFYVVDRWYGVAPDYSQVVTNMSDVDFGKPMYYNVTMGDGHTIRFHHSYVLRYEHRTAPKLVKNGLLQGWGYAEGSHILNELSRDDKLKASIQSLIDKSLIEVVKMAGMRGVFMSSDASQNDQLKKRLEMVNWARNFNSLTFLDKDDEYQQNTYSGLSGLSDLLEKNMWLIAAALDMQGILFGDLKGGFSNDTEALERYDETINARCEAYVRPVLTKLFSVLYAMVGLDEKVEFEFNSLLAKQHDEKAMDDMSKFVELARNILDTGAISLKQFAKALQNYSSRGVLDFGLDEKSIEELDDRMKEEMEGINLDE